MASNVPERFLGVAFAAGDIVLEMDTSYRILHADGAVRGTSLAGDDGKGAALPDLVSEDDKPALSGALDALSTAFRSGPVSLNLQARQGTRRFLASFGRLPHRDDRYFALLIDPAHFGGATGGETMPDLSDAEDGGRSTLEQLAHLLSEKDTGSANRLLTVLETLDANMSDTQRAEFEQRLSAMSLGGNSAVKLDDNKFAVVQEDTSGGTANRELLDGLTKATGVELQSATLDPSDVMQGEDGVRAMVYCLQQFTESAEGFDVGKLAENFGSVIQEANDNVNSFRQVLSDGAFTLVYQPIVNLQNNTTHHFEVLARFNDKKKTGTSPYGMITFAERTGLIEEFDMAVIDRVIDKLKRIADHQRPPSVAVNVSGRSLQSDTFIDPFLRKLARHQKLHPLLSFEITESAEIKDPDALRPIINKIRDMNFGVYLDDFGAGAAGFSYLKALRVDGVKIDGSYIRDAIRSQRDHAFLRCMVSLCQELQVATVGEWVETDQQAQLLRSMGVTYGQGFLYGKPQAGMGTRQAV